MSSFLSFLQTTSDWDEEMALAGGRYRAGVTNLYETESYFLGTHER